MEPFVTSGVLAVFIGIFVLFLIFQLLKLIWKRRSNPMDPADKQAGRRLLRDLFIVTFGFGDKSHNYGKTNQEKRDENESDADSQY